MLHTTSIILYTLRLRADVEADGSNAYLTLVTKSGCVDRSFPSGNLAERHSTMPLGIDQTGNRQEPSKPAWKTSRLSYRRLVSTRRLLEEKRCGRYYRHGSCFSGNSTRILLPHGMKLRFIVVRITMSFPEAILYSCSSRYCKS